MDDVPKELLMCPFVTSKVARQHDQRKCGYAHNYDDHRKAFASWLQWNHPEKPGVALDLECLDWGQVREDSSKREFRFLAVMNKSSDASLVLEEVLGLKCNFELADFSAPVDGYVRLDPAVVIPPLSQTAIKFSFLPNQVGFAETSVSLVFNNRAVVAKVELQATVLSAIDFATFHSASRMVIGEAFHPPAFKESVWNVVVPIVQAISLLPLHCGKIVTPVELCWYLCALIGGFGRFGRVDERFLNPLARATLNKFKRYPFLITKEKGKFSCHLNQNTIAEWKKDTSHAMRLARILVLEELALDEQALSFDLYFKDFVALNSVSPETGENLFSLQVTGASEARPQLLKGDYVRIRPADLVPSIEIWCTVCSVSKTGLVTLAVPRGIAIPGKVHARFMVSRIRFRRMHEAIWTVRSSQIAISFASAPFKEFWDLSHESFKNSQLSSDQKKAICMVINAFHHSKDDVKKVAFHRQPILLLGAAGSGKTETIMEIVKRIFANFDSGNPPRILLCAPSNGAADVLALRVDALNLKNVTMLRLNSHQRPETELLGGGKLKKYCYKDAMTGLHALPPLLSAFSLVVSTCATAGWISDQNPAYSFDLVIIDECAQALEAEALIAASLSGGALLLCGDPKQFGPVLRSSRSMALGAGSLLDRLAGQSGWEQRKVVLHNNFRAHPQLLALSSALFYEGKAKASVAPGVCEKLLGFEDLRGASIPLCFYGVAGKDERDSESFWNVAECFKVAELVQKVLSSPNLAGAVTVSDIGVVAPFYRQVRLIREVLRERGLGAVRVGSVADYQGQEEEVLIVSVVRSNAKYVGRDVANNVGLIHSDRSFNVCVTRAKCLLLVAGNPRVLSADPNWRRLLQIAQENKTYHGIDYDVNKDRHFSEAELSTKPPEQDFAVLGNYAFDLPWDLSM